MIVINKMHLQEADLLRVLALAMLLIDHSFACQSGFWPAYEGMEAIPAYYWIGRLSYACMLPLWVFLSGYLNGFHIYGRGRSQNLRRLAKRKGYRLLVPCYLLGFGYLIATGSLRDLLTARGVWFYLSGLQHLWFLPMLFWTFLASALIHQYVKSERKILIFTGILSICCINIASLGIGAMCYYLFYFEMGMTAYKHRTQWEVLAKGKILRWLALGFAVMFPVLTIAHEAVLAEGVNSVSDRVVTQILMHLADMPCAVVGILLCYGQVTRYCARHEVAGWISLAATMSFSVYLIHQFVLEPIYFASSLIHIFPSWAMPWVALMIVTVVSFGIAAIIHRSARLKSIFA